MLLKQILQHREFGSERLESHFEFLFTRRASQTSRTRSLLDSKATLTRRTGNLDLDRHRQQNEIVLANRAAKIGWTLFGPGN